VLADKARDHPSGNKEEYQNVVNNEDVNKNSEFGTHFTQADKGCQLQAGKVVSRIIHTPHRSTGWLLAINLINIQKKVKHILYLFDILKVFQRNDTGVD